MERRHPLINICEMSKLTLAGLQQNWSDISGVWKDELRLRFQLEYMADCIKTPRIFSLECERLAVMFEKAHHELEDTRRN